MKNESQTHDASQAESEEHDASSLSEGDGQNIGERIFYRNQEEFDKALNTAAESISRKAGPDFVGHLVFWGILIAIGFFVFVDRLFQWDLRRTLIPGVDLVKLLGIVLGGLVIYFLAWRQSQHGRILRNRLCLKCGTPLTGIHTNQQGDGICPNCQREFNLGEYRPPGENRGKQFRGYLDVAHFDAVMFKAAEQIKKTKLLGFEADLMGTCWIALGINLVSYYLLGWDLFDWLPVDIPVNGITFVVLLIWGGWYSTRVKKLLPAILDQRLCMNCGYCLLHSPTDDTGHGRCPECGDAYGIEQYEKPPEDQSEEAQAVSTEIEST
ncbi:MAG: hypothetical protein O7G85_09640 [Planctomycetota bacterium]|nr:hypothetical protein [Planctomycetota bacterium]